LSSAKAPKIPTADKTSSILPPFITEKIERQLLETITSSVNNVLAPERLAEAALQVFLEMTEAQGASIYLQDEQTGTLRCVAAHGAGGVLSPEEREQIVAQVVRESSQARAANVLAYSLKRGKHLEGVLLVEGLPADKAGGDGVGGVMDFVASRLAVGLDHSRLAQK